MRISLSTFFRFFTCYSVSISSRYSLLTSSFGKVLYFHPLFSISHFLYDFIFSLHTLTLLCDCDCNFSLHIPFLLCLYFLAPQFLHNFFCPLSVFFSISFLSNFSPHFYLSNLALYFLTLIYIYYSVSIFPLGFLHQLSLDILLLLSISIFSPQFLTPLSLSNYSGYCYSTFSPNFCSPLFYSDSLHFLILLISQLYDYTFPLHFLFSPPHYPFFLLTH